MKIKTHKAKRLTRIERVKLILSLVGYSQLDAHTFEKPSGRSDIKICRLLKDNQLEVRLIDYLGNVKNLQTMSNQVLLRNCA